MWPKLMMQLLPQLMDLLPHVSRVVPAADRYLAQRGANDAKLDALASGVRDDLGRVAKAHVAMATQLDAFATEVGRIGTQSKEAAAEATRARMAAELLQARLSQTERSVGTLRNLLVVALVLLVAALVMLMVLLLHGR